MSKKAYTKPCRSGTNCETWVWRRVALHLMDYNFCRVLQTLRVTPATEAGITGHVWIIEEVVRFLDKTALSETV